MADPISTYNGDDDEDDGVNDTLRSRFDRKTTQKSIFQGWHLRFCRVPVQ